MSPELSALVAFLALAPCIGGLWWLDRRRQRNREAMRRLRNR